MWIWQLRLEGSDCTDSFKIFVDSPSKLESLEKLEIGDIIGSLQTAVLISSTAILRRALNLYGPD